MKKTNTLNIVLQYLIPKHAVSRLMGKLASFAQWVGLKNFFIRVFIKHYQVDLSDACETDYREYKTFNAFFTRPLKPSARPIDADPYSIVSPADGTVSETGDIQDGRLIQAKKYRYSLVDLLGGLNVDEAKNSIFENGKFMTVYLSPKDYHRVHAPLGGTYYKNIVIPGKLFSVNPQTVSHVPNLFAQNKRVVTFFETSAGKMAVIFVGAVIVGSIHITAPQNTFLEKGGELGYFQLGSTAIVLFQQGKMNWNENLIAGSLLKMGEKVGSLTV